METKIVIDHERYGERTEFASLDEAQAAIDACGFDEPTELTEHGVEIRDERGDVVGHVVQLRRDEEQFPKFKKLASRLLADLNRTVK